MKFKQIIKVAIVTSWLSRKGGGVSTVVEELSNALTALPEIQVRVFGLEDCDWKERDQFAWRGAPALALRTVGPKAFGYAPDLLNQLLAWNPDIVHSHGLWTLTSKDVARWSKLTGQPYLVSPHGMLDEWAVNRSKIKKRIASFVYENKHLEGAFCTHALCQAEHDAIRASGITGPICVIPNGIKLPETTPSRTALWAEGLPHNSRILLFLGRLHPKKNIDSLIKAFAQMPTATQADKHSQWHLVIGGWDQLGYGQALENLSLKYAVRDRIRFVGPLYGVEKVAAMRSASALVLPSLSEGLPMTVLEAWSFGLPVIMTAACNLPEGFQSNAAFQISTEPDKMATQLADFLSLSDADLKQMGVRGMQLAESHFSWSRVAVEMVSVYSWILGAERPKGSVRFSRESRDD